ncbi:hypothetical protein [Natronincola peptidivorans]|uniref:hypothetical protein n=1 Tax=Natronincola peptidivorans TaxID=426128 RepID=UPI001481529C|nr:hypothetical protein [Natronincola peptidivorans]
MKDMTMIGIVGALTVVIGYVFYFMGSFLPIPGHKFIILAPFLGFMLFIPVQKVQKIGVITTVSTVFAILMTPVTLFMGIAIFLTGITTDLITLLLFRDYKHSWKIMASVGLYPMISILLTFFVSYHFTGNAMYKLLGNWVHITILSSIIYILGIVGAYLSSKIIYNRVASRQSSHL